MKRNSFEIFMIAIQTLPQKVKKRGKTTQKLPLLPVPLLAF